MPTLTEPVLLAGRMSALVQPTLAVDELVVRPWTAADAPAVLAAYRDPTIRRWYARSMETLREASAWIESWPERWQQEAGADWAVADASGVLGRVGFKGIDHYEGNAEMAYWVVASGRGRGVAPRSVDLVSRWAFGTLGLHRLHLIHSTANPASCRVAAKAGTNRKAPCAVRAVTSTAGTTCIYTRA